GPRASLDCPAADKWYGGACLHADLAGVVGLRGDLAEPIEVLCLEKVVVAIVDISSHEFSVMDAQLLGHFGVALESLEHEVDLFLHDRLIVVEHLDYFSLRAFGH